MSGVPYTFATATTSIPLSQLDANFATNATLGNATVGLGNTTTIVGNLTLQNPTITGVSSNITFASGTNGIVFNNSGATGNSTLNDYETGTWTPNQGSGLTVVGTFSSYGYYTKIGNIVYVSFTLAGSTSIAVGGNGGTAISNLPIAALGTNSCYGAGVIYNNSSTQGNVIEADASAIYVNGSSIGATTRVYGIATYQATY